MAVDIKKFIGRFIEEARDHIVRMNDSLAALDSGSADGEVVNALFRSAHTIKGSSRMLKLASITQTAHKLEDVLGAMRDGTVSFSPALGQALYRGVDATAALVERLAETSDPASLPSADAALCAELDRATQGLLAAPEPQTVTPASPGAVEATAPEAAKMAATDAKLKTPDTVRVRLAKLDEIIKLMGEVVSSHARMRQRLLDVRTIERGMRGNVGVDGLEPHRVQLHQFVQTLKEDVLDQETLMSELHDKALVMRMLPLAIVFDPAGRMIRELAHSLGKQVECVVSGAEIELDRQMIDKLSDPLIHLLRNAVDHGMELPEVRRQAGKPPQGRIKLSAYQDGGWVVIDVADDGAGIRIDQVKDKAVRKGFISAEKAAAMTDQEAIELIFLPGFSTNAIITDMSGRGVGMDVVKQSIVDDLQGVVAVDTRPGSGSTFSLRLPLSLAVMRVLLVDVGGLSFGFTAQFVAELLRLPHEALMNVAERNAVIIRNEFVPVVPLADLLSSSSSAVGRKERNQTRSELGLLLLVIRVRSEKIALVIDALVDERDMVIKPLPDHMRKIDMVSGMVITGKNELVSVLHAPALLERARKLRSQSVHDQAVGHADAKRDAYTILVVDDSLNTREIEKDVLEAWGYHVTLAEDGQDGLNKALAGDFDAILTDVEMPSMDGFTLTARLRLEDKYRTRPIVIITSREKEEDKRRGIEAGADAYIVKGDFDQSSLVDTLKALLG